VLGLLRWLLLAIFVALGYLVVSYLAAVLAPILAALGIAYLLNPVLEAVVRRGHVGRTLGAGILLVLFLAVLAGALAFVIPRVVHQASQFIDDAPRMLDNLTVWAKDKLGVELPSDWKGYVSGQHHETAVQEVAQAAVGGAFSVLGTVAELLLVPVFAFYFMADWPNLLRRIDHVVPPRRRGEVREIAHEIDRVVAGWVRGQAIVTLILAALYSIGFTIVGMPLPLPIGLLVAVLTVIPFVGTFVGASIALLVTLADGGSLQMLASIGGVFLVLHLLEAAVLTPKIVGHRVGLSESGALLAVVAGGKLLGFVGIVLAVPIAATVAVLVRHAIHFYEHTSFYGHESDADVVITPAMALIMPGVPIHAGAADGGAHVIASQPLEPELEPELEPSDDWALAPELGPSGIIRPPKLD
jgi:predicted PurR-regulated permease PerM